MINYNFTISRRYDWLKLYTSPTLMFLYGKHPQALCWSKSYYLKVLKLNCEQEALDDPKNNPRKSRENNSIIWIWRTYNFLSKRRKDNVKKYTGWFST